MNILSHEKQAIIIACNIRRIREKAKLTEYEVAELAGIKRSVYVKYEKATSLMSILNLVKIADALNVPVDEILFGIREALKEE